MAKEIKSFKVNPDYEEAEMLIDTAFPLFSCMGLNPSKWCLFFIQENQALLYLLPSF